MLRIDRRLAAAFAFTAVVGVLACAPQPVYRPLVARGCPAPVPPALDPALAANHATFITYIKTLNFDAAHPSGDTKDLPVLKQHADGQPDRDANGNLQYRQGPRGDLAPERCAYVNHDGDLKRGRIVARVVITPTPGTQVPYSRDSGYSKLHYHNPATDPGPYPHVHDFLPRDTSYIWVDSLRDSVARGVIIPQKLLPNRQPRRVRVTYERNPTYPGTDQLVPNSYSWARWRFVPLDDHLWVSCAEYGCCTVGDATFADQ
jgi:hypothetical protein